MPFLEAEEALDHPRTHLWKEVHGISLFQEGMEKGMSANLSFIKRDGQTDNAGLKVRNEAFNKF